MNFTRILLLLTVFFASPLLAMQQVTYKKGKNWNGYVQETYAVTIDGVMFKYSCVWGPRGTTYCCGSQGADLSTLEKYILILRSNEQDTLNSLLNEKHRVLEPMTMTDHKAVFEVLERESNYQEYLKYKQAKQISKGSK